MAAKPTTKTRWKRIVISGSVLACLFAVLQGAPSFGGASPAKVAGERDDQKWEYKVNKLINHTELTAEELNKDGDAGWEIVGFTAHTQSNNGLLLILKRPRQS